MNLQNTEIYWSSEITRYLLASLLSFCVVFLILRNRKEENRVHMNLLALSQLNLALFSLFEAFSDMFHSLLFRHFGLLCEYISLLMLLLFVIYGMKEILYSPSIVFFCLVFGILIGLDMTIEQSWEPINSTEYSWHRPNIFLFLGIILMIIVFLEFWNWAVKLYKRVPSRLRKATIILGFGPIGLFIFLYSLTIWIYVSTITSLFMIGIALNVLYISVRYPELFTLLPFSAHNLIVIEKKSGISLFSFQWSDIELKDHLFAGLISAMMSIGEKELKQGVVKELVLNSGRLSITMGNNIIVGLISSKIPLTLKRSLDQFTIHFEDYFSDHLQNLQKVNFEVFREASKLIEQNFGRLPIESRNILPKIIQKLDIVYE